MRAHQIKDGKVTNTIAVDRLDIRPDLIDADHGGEIGDLWDGMVFTKPTKTPEELAAIAAAEAKRLAAIAAQEEIELGTISGMTYVALDSYIDTTVTDLAKAKVYLKRLSRVVKALVDRV
jgi:hypothetical protein